MTLRVINFADGFTSENVPTADAIQAHIDNPTDAHDASAISYDNTDSELAAIDVQAAIDEVELRLDTAENDIQAIEDSIGQANGIAPLNGSAKIDATYLPSYVDDVLEFANLAAFPVTGETGKIYVTLDTNKTYRWTGSVYVEISASPVTSVNGQTGVVTLNADNIAETATRYWSKKNNVANTMPLVGNDASQNYSIGSQWYDAINDTLYICEDATIGAAVWQPISGAGGGVGSVDIMFADTFENTDIADYTITQPFAEISDVSPLQGENSLLIEHDYNPNYYIERIIPVDDKFKNKNVTFSLDVFSDASSGNLTLSVWDHTNTVQLLNSELIQPQETGETSVKRTFSFVIPSGANDLRYRINVLFDSGKISKVDNLVIELTETAKLATTIEVPVITEPIEAGPMTISATVTAPTKGVMTTDTVTWHRVGKFAHITYRFYQSATTGAAAGSGEYLYSLPPGLVVDTSYITPFTGAGLPENKKALIGEGEITSASGPTNGSTYAVLYNSNQFRLYTYAYYSNGNYQSNTYYFLNQAVLGHSVTIHVPILGWEATAPQEIQLTQSALVQESDSAIRIQQVLGNGSTNTFMRRFANSLDNTGDAFTYAPSSILGDSITVNKSGVYSIEYSENFNTAAVSFSIVRNYSVNVAPTSVPIQNRLATGFSENVIDWGDSISWSGYLSQGDVIRFFTGVNTIGTNASQAQVSMSYQGKLKQVNVSENQKIEIPTSELRMEGASSRGTGSDAAVVRFNNIAKLRGDAFEIESTAALGTVITMKKKGKLDVSSSVRIAAAATLDISKNQSIRTGLSIIPSEIMARVANNSNFTTTVSCEFFVDIGDKVRIISDNGVTANDGNSLNLSFQEQEVSVSVTNVLPQFSESDSSVRLNTANGYGSTNTRIRRFSNVVENTGSSVTYADSATLGSSFTINEDAIYNISYTDNIGGGIRGISLNSSLLTTNVESLPVAQVLACSSGAGIESVSWQGRLQVGDVVRPHTDGSANAGFCIFTISKVGKPNVTGVDVTPFAGIEYEVKQFVTATNALGYASTATRIPYFNSITNTNNGLLSVGNDSINGFSVTALKACEFDFNAEAAYTVASNAVVSVNGSVVTNAVSLPSANILDFTNSTQAGHFAKVSASLKLSVGDVVRLHTDAAPISNGIYWRVSATATELRDAYQVIGSGVENTYSARINNNGTASLISQSYPFIDSVNRTSLGVVTINLKSGFFAEIPAVSAVTISGQDVRFNSISTTSLVVNTFNTATFSDADYNFNILVQRQGSDYRTPSKVVGLPAQRVAVIKDVKVAGSAMQPLTASVWTTRVLNNLIDPTGLVTSLASNQFILPAGKYFISARCPVMSGVSGISFHKAALYNVTDLANILIGTTERTLSPSGSSHTGNSVVEGHFTLTAQKTLDIRHIVNTTYSAEAPPSFSSTDEIYTMVVITKIEE